MAFWPGQKACGKEKMFGMETDAKHGPGGGNWVYIGP